ncbi:concanavalin A-like lectin/glucanase domain-containing protein [Apiospora arundinis]|uniref:Uncharacterized protein n=1 Tax=Apiospora arundinis TaxID=335852 RepID=A0ABR2II11_9PEZI
MQRLSSLLGTNDSHMWARVAPMGLFRNYARCISDDLIGTLSVSLRCHWLGTDMLSLTSPRGASRIGPHTDITRV